MSEKQKPRKSHPGPTEQNWRTRQNLNTSHHRYPRTVILEKFLPSESFPIPVPEDILSVYLPVSSEPLNDPQKFVNPLGDTVNSRKFQPREKTHEKGHFENKKTEENVKEGKSEKKEAKQKGEKKEWAAKSGEEVKEFSEIWDVDEEQRVAEGKVTEEVKVEVLQEKAEKGEVEVVVEEKSVKREEGNDEVTVKVQENKIVEDAKEEPAEKVGKGKKNKKAQKIVESEKKEETKQEKQQKSDLKQSEQHKHHEKAQKSDPKLIEQLKHQEKSQKSEPKLSDPLKHSENPHEKTKPTTEAPKHPEKSQLEKSSKPKPYPEASNHPEKPSHPAKVEKNSQENPLNPIKSTQKAPISTLPTPSFDKTLLTTLTNSGNPFARVLLFTGKPGEDPSKLYFPSDLRAFERVWFYKDSLGSIRGPFSCLEMFLWSSKGAFPSSMLIAFCNTEFLPMDNFSATKSVKKVPEKVEIVEETVLGKKNPWSNSAKLFKDIKK